MVPLRWIAIVSMVGAPLLLILGEPDWSYGALVVAGVCWALRRRLTLGLRKA